MNKKEDFIKNYIRNIAQQEILKDKIQQIKINSKIDEIKQAMKNCNKEPDDSKYFKNIFEKLEGKLTERNNNE